MFVMHTFLAFIFWFILAIPQALSSPAGSKSNVKDEVASQPVPINKTTKFKESSDATITSSNSAQQRISSSRRASRRKSDQRYKSQFTKEAMER